MRVLGSAVLGVEVIVVLLATVFAAADGTSAALAWACGLALMVLLVVTIAMLGRRWGVRLGWLMQGLVLATSLVVGLSMLVVGMVFAVLWLVAVRNGRRVDALREAAAAAAEDR